MGGTLKPARFYRFQALMPRRPVFAVAYGIVAVMAGVVGYNTIHSSSAAPLATSQVQLLMSQNTYYIGEIPRFTIVNGSSQTVTVANNCPNEPLTVFRQEGQSWIQLHQTFANDSKCVNEPRAYAIVPKAQVSASYAFWPELFATPGHYKVVAPLAGHDAGPQAEFDVVAKTAP